MRQRIEVILVLLLAVGITLLLGPVTELAVFRYTVEREAVYFPVGADISGGQDISFEDSFGDARSFGGKRKHEGCDIMAGNGKPGYFPIFSVCEGTVEKLGWLKLGGYRIGIRSDSGVYYYYAHLDSYAKGLSQGDRIEAGTLLGFMGDSGYGAEGTKGEFPVHLHFGIYTGTMEKGQNPFWILKRLKDKRIAFIPVPVVE